MTRPFAAVERLIERIFERPAARIFRASAEPEQLRIRLEHAMDDARRPVEGHASVPHAFEVRLAPADAAALRADEPDLEEALADGLLRYARRRGYRLAARPVVHLVARHGLGRAEVEVAAVGPAAIGPAAIGPAPAGAARDDEARPNVAEPWVPAHVVGRAGGPDLPAARAGSGAAPDARSVRDPAGHPRERGGSAPPWPVRPLEATAVLQVPPPATSIVLVVGSPGQPPREMLLEGPACTLGRAGDNDLVLADSRVSRHHGKITARHGTLVYVDLGSTNGSRVNGEPVREVVLGTGDVLQVGDTTISVQSQG